MEYITYKIRWVVLFGIFVATVNRQMSIAAFGLRNGDLAQYFNATPYQIDVLSVGDSILATLTCLCLSVIGRHVGVRISSLIVGCCSTLGNLLVSVGFITRNYYCVLSGRLIAGVAVGLMYILPGTFANAWFPSTQIATAFCVTFFGFNFGGGIASVVYSIEFPEESTNSSANGESYSKDAIGSLYSTVFEASTATLLCATIIFCCFARDRPPSPPSEAEALLSRNTEDEPEFDLKSDLLVSVKLLFNRPFVLLTLGNFFDTAALVIFFTLMPSLVTATFPQKGISTIISYVNVSAYFGATCMAFASGRFLDKTKWYKGVSCGGSIVTSMLAIGVALGHHFQSLITVCIFYPLMFVSRVGTITSFVEFLVEATYPTHKTVLISLHFTFYNVAYFAMASVERAAFHVGGSTICIIIPIVCSALGCICALFVEPDYRRSRANDLETTSTK